MKRIICYALVILTFAICLTSCSNEPKIDASLMEYPGLKWNSSVEDAKKALNLRDDQVISEVNTEDYIQLVVKDLTLFGYPLKGALFYFLPSENGIYGLGNIEAYFTEDTDMTEVRDAMIEIYGDGDIWSGEDYHINAAGELETVYGKKEPDILQHYWKASANIKKLVPTENLSEVVDFFASINPNATRETVDEWVDKVSVGRIVLTDSSNKEGMSTDNPIFTRKVVSFGGDFILMLLQNFN